MCGPPQCGQSRLVSTSALSSSVVIPWTASSAWFATPMPVTSCCFGPAGLARTLASRSVAQPADRTGAAHLGLRRRRGPAPGLAHVVGERAVAPACYLGAAASGGRSSWIRRPPSAATQGEPAYLSHPWQERCGGLGLRQLRTRPHTPRPNGRRGVSSRPCSISRPTVTAAVQRANRGGCRP